jgi:hypothetical protein
MDRMIIHLSGPNMTMLSQGMVFNFFIPSFLIELRQFFSRNCSYMAAQPLNGFYVVALPLNEFYLPRFGFLKLRMNSLPSVGFFDYEMNSLPMNGFFESNGLPLVEVFYLPTSECKINHNKIEKISKKILVKFEKNIQKNLYKIWKNWKKIELFFF